MGAGEPKRQPFCWRRTDQISEGAEPARIDNDMPWNGLAPPSKGGQSAAAIRAAVCVRVRRDFALCRDLGQKRRPCVRLRGACEPFLAPGRALRRSRAATACYSCPTRGLPQGMPNQVRRLSANRRPRHRRHEW